LVIREIRELVSRDYKEVVLSGIHLGSYGRDLEPRTSFEALIRRILAEVPELERLRPQFYRTPGGDARIVALVAEEPRLAHHLHVPLQSGSGRILREMRRPYTPSYYFDLMQRIHSRIDDAAIGADVMVGFPGESDNEFFETYQLIEESAAHVPARVSIFLTSRHPCCGDDRRSSSARRKVSSQTLRQLIARKNEEFRTRMNRARY
jgi:threonylcarbamoyladenosine tRNA methylthiotransferase MtaB